MDDYQRIGTRIRGIRENRGETQERLARLLGVTPEAVGHYERGRSRVSVTDLQRIADHYGVSLSYFLDRDTDNDRAAAELKRLADQTERFREEVKAMGGIFDMVYLPVYGSIPAGWPELDESELLGYEPVPRSEIKSEKSFWLKVSGDSLEGAGIDNGDLVLIDPGQEHSNGNIVGIRLETGDSVIRRAYKEEDGLRLESENPAFTTIHITEGEVTAYGVATRVQKKLI